MSQMTSECLGRACRLFMDLAYPGGLDTIPPKKLPYYHLPADAPLADFLPPAARAAGVCQSLAGKEGKHGYEFRLGSAYFPHLKLRVHEMDHRGTSLWVYSVDTHDAFSRSNYAPPAEHPDAAAWRSLQEKNALLKARIEEALEAAGFVTFKGLLRMGLPSPAAVCPPAIV
jgi:hypothetical protein